MESVKGSNANYESKRKNTLATIKEGDTVKVHYTGTIADGTVFDSSREREPLEVTLGEGKLIPGFEKAVVGMNVGDTSKVTIPSEEAYGEKREDMVIDVDRGQIPPDIKPEVGQQLQIQQKDGGAIPVVITEVTDETVQLDANHPLAGQELTFEIEVVEVVG
ncbi:MAG: peptidylprolyl isomerase [Balneolaceae bacterium]|nr:MAG: peptidylprolyl isomerase [Balneolaceae bacterium]